jgi:hypothetical protein
VSLHRHLVEDGLGDVVVAEPIDGSFGVRELVQEVPVVLGGKSPRLGVDGFRVVHQVTRTSLRFYQSDLFRARGRRHDCREWQAQKPSEVCFRDGR